MRHIALGVVLLVAAGRAAAAEPAVSTTAHTSLTGELRKQRAHQRSVRNTGLLLIGGAVALGATSGLAVALGKRNNDVIAVGGFETAQDIEDRAAIGRRYNLAAWCLAGAGVALAGTGFALVLTHPDPRRPRIEATPVDGGAIVGVSGVLQ